MSKFIYVFNKEDCDAMIAAGYKLMKTTKGELFTFLNHKERFSPPEGKPSMEYVLSDRLTF